MLKQHAEEELKPFIYGSWQQKQEILGYVREYRKGCQSTRVVFFS